MKVKCPKCRQEYDLKATIREEDLFAILQMRDVFVPNSALVFEYADLFDTVRPIKAAKLLRLLTELKVVWKSGEFNHGKRRFKISRDGMAQALRTVCNRTFSEPLTNHNYLKKVMVSISEKEEEARSIQDEKALKKKEGKLRSGRRPENEEKGSMPDWFKKEVGLD